MSDTSKSKRLRQLLLSTLLGVLSQTTALAQDTSIATSRSAAAGVQLVVPEQPQKLRMVVNTSRELMTEQPFQRVRIQNPNILNVIPLEGGNRLQISATHAGVTQLDLMAADNTIHSIEVMVVEDARELEAILRQQFPSANLTITPVQQGCIVSGVVTNDEHVEQVIKIAELYFETVIDKVSVMGVHTVQLETQIMEVSRTKLRELGIDWGIINGDDFVSQSVSGVLAASSSAAGLTTSGAETFKVGVVQSSTHFLGAVKALRQNNLIKVLANPTITAVDGRPASFNAGGEIPILIPAGMGTVGVQYREYGTRVDMVAKVRGEGRIWLEVRPYVSEIDTSRSVTLQGFSVPGLRSRFLETGVELQAGQTLALGGLLQSRTEASSAGLPFFGDLPYVGALFRVNREVQNEVELIITVTPNFAEALDPCEVPAGGPGFNTSSPTDKELYLKGHIETPKLSQSCPQPQGLAEVPQPLQMQPSALMLPQVEGASTVPNPAAMSVGPNSPILAQPVTQSPSTNMNTARQPIYSPVVR